LITGPWAANTAAAVSRTSPAAALTTVMSCLCTATAGVLLLQREKPRLQRWRRVSHLLDLAARRRIDTVSHCKCNAMCERGTCLSDILRHSSFPAMQCFHSCEAARYMLEMQDLNGSATGGIGLYLAIAPEDEPCHCCHHMRVIRALLECIQRFGLACGPRGHREVLR